MQLFPPYKNPQHYLKIQQIFFSQVNQFLSLRKLVLQLEYNYMITENSNFLIQQNDGYPLTITHGTCYVIITNLEYMDGDKEID